MPVSFDPGSIRRQFVFFGQQKPLIYLDSAATTQKPAVVLEAVKRFYEAENGSGQRGIHRLAEAATARWEEARAVVATFLHAPSPDTIVLTKSATESLNLVARSLGETWSAGDAIAISVLEHHSNIVPWQQLKQRRGIDIRWIPCDEEGTLDLAALDRALADGKVKLVSVTAQSNVLGVRPDIAEIIRRAHAAGALACIDAAQRVAHGDIDVQTLDCDFLAFSGHKVFGPTGIGALYGKRALLAAIPPFLGGGGMVQDVTLDGFIAADAPTKFEAGTLPIGEAVGLATAISWLRSLPAGVAAHEHMLLAEAAKIGTIPGVTVLGPADPSHRHGCVSFTVDGLHAHDLADLLAAEGICVRSGHLCAKPLHAHLGLAASCRVSVAPYNTLEDIIAFHTTLETVITRWRR